MKKRIFLTGGSGFVGRNIIEILGNKYEIFAPSHAELDLLNMPAVEVYMKQRRFDVVIHGAATGISRKDNTVEASLMNIRMFTNLARCSSLYGKMIYLGSGAAYDKRRDLIKITEDKLEQSAPSDPYGFAKYTCSLLVERYENIIDLRVFAVFGKYEDYETRFISNVICRTLVGLPVTIVQNVRFDYFSVDDLVRVIDYFIGHAASYKVYNVCSGQTVSLTEIVTKIEKISKKNIPFEIKQAGFNKEYSGDNRRLLAEIPNFSFALFDEALSNLYNWYAARLEQIDKKRLLFDR